MKTITLSIAFIITVLLIAIGVISCQNKAPPHISNVLLFQSKENISTKEYVEIFYDINEENLCYFYHFDNERAARFMTCVKKNNYYHNQ